MSISISKSFVKEFESEVHLAYQRMGSRLRQTVRTKSNIIGSHAVFQRISKGSAGIKSRHGMVPVMNIDHTPIECQLRDYYAGDWVDAIDELKVQHDERQVLVNAGAYALGRKTDEMIINELRQAGNSASQVVVGSDRLSNDKPITIDKVVKAFEILGENDVPDDGSRFAVIGWKQWGDLLRIPEFASSDFIGESELPWKGGQAKKWLGTTWIAHSGLPILSGIRTCFWYHKTAIGHASGQDIVSDISWHGDRAAHFVSNRISHGACLIDPKGVVIFKGKE